MVAIGATTGMSDVKADPASLAAVNNPANNAVDYANRQMAADRANRDTTRGTASSTADQATQALWLLPVKHYTIESPFGQHADSLHQGVTLAVPEGTPYFAAHGGVVTLARYDGGLGYTVVVDIGNGISITYGHSAKLLVREGQRVQAGDAIGMVGSTGYAFGNALYFQIDVHGKAVNPVTYLQQFGLDVVRGSDALTS